MIDFVSIKQNHFLITASFTFGFSLMEVFSGLFLFVQAAQIKGCEDLNVRIDPILNHFWYCCQVANTDEETLKVSLKSFVQETSEKDL